MGRKKSIVKSQYQELEDLVLEGYNDEELAEHFNCTPFTIRKYLQDYTDIAERVGDKRPIYKKNKGHYYQSGGYDTRIYAVYKKDKLINIGTIDDIAKQRGVNRKSVQYLTTPTHLKRTSEENGARMICIEDEITRVEPVSETLIRKIIQFNASREGTVLGYYDEKHEEYCICDNSDNELLIDFYESKIEMLKAGYLLERKEDYE